MIVLHILLLFSNALIGTCVDKTDVRRTLYIGDTGTLTLYSPGYPRSSNDELSSYIKYRGPKSQPLIHMKFDDLDLHKNSVLSLYDGDSDTAKSFKWQPRYNRGLWERPINTAKSGGVLVIYKPATMGDAGSDTNSTKSSLHPNPGSQHVGFKMTIWTSASAGDDPYKVVTTCPYINEAMDSGMIELGPTESASKDYKIECIWQLKPPPSPKVNPLFQVFVRFEQLDLANGHLEIHSEAYSDSEATLNIIDKNYSELPLTFTSREGFYIRVKKPLHAGTVKFTYGVFEKVSDPKKCIFKFTKESEPGHMCKDSDWCIPKEHCCNFISNCPRGDDESKTLCQDKDIPPVIPIQPEISNGQDDQKTRRYEIVQFSKDCEAWEKECPDNSCIAPWEFCTPVNGECGYIEKYCRSTNECKPLYFICPGKCLSEERECADGACVKKYDRCAEDPCENWYSMKCNDGTCLYEYSLCDGIEDCPDGADEAECDVMHFDYSLTKWLFVIFLVPIVCAILYCKVKRDSHARERRLEMEAMNDGNEREALNHNNPIIGITSVSNTSQIYTEDDAISGPGRPAVEMGSEALPAGTSPPSYEEAGRMPSPQQPNYPPPSYEDAVCSPGSQSASLTANTAS